MLWLRRWYHFFSQLHTKVADLGTCVNDMNKAISRLGKYSSDSNLNNEYKTKWMLLSTKQMTRVHSLQTASVNISGNGESLEHATRTKLLGVHMLVHLTWNIHINELVTSWYGGQAVLRRLRNLAPFRVKKQLVESLILSKLDYASTVFYPLPLCQLKRLQRVQNVYVLGRYERKADCLQLGWLPLIERRSYQVLQYVFKSIYFDYWPQYLRLKQHIQARDLRSSCEVRLKVPITSSTFQDSSAAMFNALPSYLRNWADFRSYKRNLASYFINNTRKRLEVTWISSHLHFSLFIF